MDRSRFESSISSAWAAAQALKLGETFSNGGSLPVNVDFRDLILNPTTPYEEIFLFALRNSNYNFLLSDHSFFQFTWTAEDDVRYAYYPNPYLGPDASQLMQYKSRLELFAAEMISYDDFLNLLGDTIGQGRIPVIRYENAPCQYKELLHPCSHFHIGLHGDDRWAVRRIITPQAFTLIILKNYYGTLWRASKADDEGKFTALDHELRRARDQSAILDQDYFSKNEETAFHLF